MALVGNLWPKPLSLALLKLLKSKAQYHIPVPQCAAASRPESHTGHRCWFHLHFLLELGAWRLNYDVPTTKAWLLYTWELIMMDMMEYWLSRWSWSIKPTPWKSISPWNTRGPAAAKPAKPQLPLEQLATAPRHKDLLKASQVIWSTTMAAVLATLHSIAGFPHNSSSLAVGRNYASSGDK